MTVELPADESVPRLVPARILNEHVYCPRLAYLEWVDQGFTDNADTVEGRFVHRRVDRQRGPALPPGTEGDWPASTSVTLGSERLGLVAKLDLIEMAGNKVVPVEYKRGSPRSTARPLWEPELVQLCAQTLLLDDAGYDVDHAEAYFAETRTRHRIEIDDELVATTLAAIAELRSNVAADEAPPPLVDSPKCPRCSLNTICLPDEVNALRGVQTREPRRLIASDSPASPLYASTQGARVTKRGGRVVLIEDGEEVSSRRLIDVSHIAVFGNVTVGSALLRECFDAGVPVLWFTFGGWLSGFATGMPSKNVLVRVRQHRASALGAPEIAASFVGGKIRNSRTLIRRHGGKAAVSAIAQLAALARQAEAERRLDSLLGIEGTAARIYFAEYAKLLSSKRSLGTFDFDGRNRRPPRDPVNAMLSFVYALLVKDAVIAVLAAGLEPYLGLYHRPGFGRPALALDLAEEFRPLVADSVVLTAINNGEVDGSDFVSRAGAVGLTAAGRKKLIRTYERRMATELGYPLFGYRATYRRSLEIQARLLAAVLVGDIPQYRSLTTR